MPAGSQHGAALRAILGTVVFLLAPLPVLAERSFLADLPPDEQEALDSAAASEPLPEGPERLLEKIFLVASPYRFDAGYVVVDADRRWFSALPPSSPGSPLLEIRRWPGDTVLALYALEGATPSSGASPPIPGASLAGPKGSEDSRIWTGTIETDAGSRRIEWIERSVPGSEHARLGALLVPGDAGLGEDAAEDLLVELRFVFGKVHVREEAWKEAPEGAVAGRIALPELELPPGRDDEREDPWQVARGVSFTLGLPPGVRALRLHPEFPGPRPIPGGLMWLRGRFFDSNGDLVVLGDGKRAGYVAEVSPASDGWVVGKVPPAGVPAGKRLAAVPFEVALEKSGARLANAERWSEPGFSGEWLVFRLALRDRGIEIALPVTAGRKSPSLFWIPLTWRDAGEPPAPPPIDPAKRFGIRFERLTGADRKRNAWTEGYLSVPGLRLELPRGWWPVANLRSDDGYPVRIVGGEGHTVAWLRRLDAGDPELETAGASTTWGAVKRPIRYHARAAYRRNDGAALFVAREGHGFLLAPQLDATIDATQWQRLVESAYLLRSAR